jgi:U32 family peptidase
MIQETELLAPAGNWECARAAVANGADAIYFGLPRFNARLRADNFTEEDLPELMQFLHQNGVKGFLAFNTLIFTQELNDAEAQLARLQEAGVDGVIIQDLGLALLSKATAPSVELHASTQMTITSPEGLEFASQLGLDRAVLSRELSLRELERFKDVAVPLEVFVHGALCVAYSGQCLTSESLGQRSANRGECAQACRMPYQLVVDGVEQDLGDKKYLLSPQDLAAVDQIPDLIARGVMSFKIEGRLKSPEYVAAVTRVYRKAIDAALAGNPQPASASDRYALEMTFSRGLFSGWMHGVDHQQLVKATYGKKRGAYLGRVRQLVRDGVSLENLAGEVKPGDGLVFGSSEDTNDEQGGFVYEVRGPEVTFGRGKVDWRAIRPGDHVWKTSDPALDRHLRSSFKGNITPRKHVAVDLSVHGTAGQPLSLTASIRGQQVGDTLTSEINLVPAEQRPLTRELLHEQFNRLGGTVFEIQELTCDLSGPLMLPLSEIGKLRRKLVAVLETTLERKNAPAALGTAKQWLEEIRGLRQPISQNATLTVLCRSLAQIQAVAALELGELYADFEDVRGYTEAVQWMRENHPQQRLYLATPRIQKAGEQGFFKLIERAEPQGVLVRNLGALVHFRELQLPLVGDFSLNVANPITARFLQQQGLQRMAVSYDLNIEQALALAEHCPPEWLEVTIHQHMPMFHMEHCVFAAFLSKGSTFLDCGRPCEKHSVRLRDRVGMEHPLKADVGCRNTLFNATAQTAARHYPELHAAGVRSYRVELLNESPEAAASLVQVYQAILANGKADAGHMRKLNAREQYGVTSGTLSVL